MGFRVWGLGFGVWGLGGGGVLGFYARLPCSIPPLQRNAWDSVLSEMTYARTKTPMSLNPKP